MNNPAFVPIRRAANSGGRVSDDSHKEVNDCTLVFAVAALQMEWQRRVARRRFGQVR